MAKPKSRTPAGGIPGAIEGDPVAFFQSWFNDRIPHNAALRTKVLSIGKGKAVMQLDWAEHLVGAPETGILAGGPITALLDSCSGMSVATRLAELIPFATLDLRIDYAKPAVPGKPVIAEAECYRITRSVAFTRAFAHQGDPKDPVAAAAGTFMLGTKGEVTHAQAVSRELNK
jgi:uncharacterized protein (TIGR00369 family)